MTFLLRIKHTEGESKKVLVCFTLILESQCTTGNNIIAFFKCDLYNVMI